MKIKKIKIKNINSLKGTWVIDLEDPAFVENKNQFVICGETGSGKTTILDAISLACFGKTPRMEDIMTKLTNAEALNELMTRRTVSSEATVIYECRNGTFESSFKMRKTGGRADGTLKFEFTLLNLETGEPVCDTITNLKRIEEVTQQVTNLSYLQFTRSMILAQGKFDKFIGAQEEERAKIMEAISGTDYAALGRRIAAKAKSEIGKYKEKQEELKRIEILSEEEEAVLLKEKKEKPQEIKKAQELVKQNTVFLQWLELLEKYELESQKALEERGDYEKQKKDFLPMRKKLNDAEKTFACNVPYTKWAGLNAAQESDRETLADNENNLEQILSDYNELKEKAEKQALCLAEKKSEEKTVSAEWKKARELILKIESQKKLLSDSEARKENAEKKLTEEKERAGNLKTEIVALQVETEKTAAFLEENKADETLEKLLPALEEKGNNIQADYEASEILKGKIKDLENEIVKITETILGLKKDKEKADSELKELVFSKYKLISELLRKSITDGKACPVCGSENHPLCSEGKKENENPETSDIAGKIQELSDLIEKLEKEISEKTSLKEGTEKGLEEKKEDLKAGDIKIQKLLSEFNKVIEPWELKAALGKKNSFTDIYDSLEKISASFIREKENYVSYVKDFELKQKELEGIKLADLEKDYSGTLDVYNKTQKDLNLLLEKLESVCDGKFKTSEDVDGEEKLFRDEIEKLEKGFKEAEEKSKAAGDKKTSLEGSVKTLKEQIEKRAGELKTAEKELEVSLKVNGFNSTEEFEACRIEDNEYKELKAAEEELKKRETETATKLMTTAETLSSHKKSKPEGLKEGDTEGLKEEYNREKENLEKNISDLATRLGQIISDLEKNEHNKEEGLKLREELKVMEAENDKWTKIQDMIGKLDGTKFQVFVQVLFFKNLIKKANKYFTGILPEYSLVQVPGRVDFRIHSNVFNENKEDRDCGNMSGGEKFIISLSFALGISELSSRSVSIDSLFLDEGFGTLSGNALIQSVAALKKLQTAGKTLGIITHVSEVIREFDLKLEAKQVRGVSGYSELKGPGITCLEA